MADGIAEIAQRHGFSIEAVRIMADALRHGGGAMAQFAHPEFGGAGQWAAGGMVMIGDMFNNGLKARVDALCRDLASMPGPVPATAELEPERAAPSGWWPPELGAPTASGAQDNMRYAYFQEQRRLAVQQDGQVRVYDTGEHRISGFAQQQGGARSATFTSQSGPVRLDALREV